MSTTHASNDLGGNDRKKSWTIRKVDSETIEQTKKAAGRSGMKIGAWVDQKLKEAANSDCPSLPKNQLASELSQITDALDDVSSRKILERLTKIESEYTQIIKGQHHILLALQKIQSNSVSE